jgi:RimJ/RimL family protein N-acetyltransferase
MFALTPRLTLRPGWPEDAPALARAIGQRCVAENLSGLPWPYARGDAEAFLAARRAPTDIVMLICSREDDGRPVIGGIELSRVGDTDLFGYWLVPSAWGRGYMTEAGQAVIGIARDALRLRQVSSGHFVDNPASGRVLAKLGFRPTGAIEPRHCPARGVTVPTALFTLDLDAAATPAMPMAA